MGLVFFFEELMFALFIVRYKTLTNVPVEINWKKLCTVILNISGQAIKIYIEYCISVLLPPLPIEI